MKRSQPPKIHIEPESFDILLDRLGMVSILLMVLIVIFSFSGLPDIIPTRYGLSGDVIATGSRYTILLNPLIGIFTFTFIYFLNKAPHTFNYTVTITPENAPYEYRKAMRMMRWVNLICALIFLFITFRMISNAFGYTEGLNAVVMAFLIISLFGVIAYYLLYDRLHANKGSSE
ncbi:MAG: DUF1648 domain-containing protein [Balneolales bacterium]|nr:DUF1648 domain-containing protein [Balneolales bacterium]